MGGKQGLSRLTIRVREVLADLADLWQPSAFPIRCVVRVCAVMRLKKMGLWVGLAQSWLKFKGGFFGGQSDSVWQGKKLQVSGGKFGVRNRDLNFAEFPLAAAARPQDALPFWDVFLGEGFYRVYTRESGRTESITTSGTLLAVCPACISVPSVPAVPAVTCRYGSVPILYTILCILTACTAVSKAKTSVRSMSDVRYIPYPFQMLTPQN